MSKVALEVESSVKEWRDCAEEGSEEAGTGRGMFRKFSPSEDLKNLSLVKSSTVRGLRGKLQEQFPALEDPEALELVLPKKEKLSHAKTCGGGGSVQ